MTNSLKLVPKSNSVSTLLNWAERELKKNNIPSPKLDAGILLSHVLKIPREKLLTEPNMILTSPQIKKFCTLIYRRTLREPVAYLTQQKEFMSLPFYVSREVLIPRPETELLVEEVISLAQQLPSTIHMLDIGTGSGCIAVSCAKYIDKINIWATDLNLQIIHLALQNAKVNKVSSKMKFYTGNLFDALPASKKKWAFDFIVSNPPYISKSDLSKLQPDITEYEPHHALFSGNDGLNIIRQIIQQAPDYLKPKGFLLMEIGYNQGPQVKKLFQEDSRYNISSIQIKKDYAKLDRLAIAQKG